MWGAVTKAEPLVLYLQSSGQVGDQHAHTQYTQSGICVSHLWTWFGSHAQNAHTPKEALSVAHAAPVSLSHDLIGKEQAYTKRLWICFEPDAHTLPAEDDNTAHYFKMPFHQIRPLFILLTAVIIYNI